MKPNMSNLDRGIRVVVAILFVALYYGNVVSGTLGVVLLVLAAVFLLTSLVSFCPLYKLFKFSTRK